MVHPEIATAFDQRETPTINREMRELAGQIVTIADCIASYDKPRYYTREGWSWLEKWLVPVSMDENKAFEHLVKGRITESEYNTLTRTT